MRIALIDITNLTRVRRTLATGWRVLNAAAFLLSTSFWWLVLTRPRGRLVDEALTARTLVLAAAVLTPLTVALSRKNDFSRLFFALALAVNFAALTLLIFVGLYSAAPGWPRNRATEFIIFVAVIFALSAYKRHLFQPFYVLLASAVPFGPWKAFRQQVRLCLRLWSGEWKGAGRPRSLGEGVRPYLRWGTPYRMAFGWFWFALGTAHLLAALVGFFSHELVPALGRLELSKVWRLFVEFLTMPLGRAPDDLNWPLHAARCAFVFLLGLFCYFLYGFFLTQWRRERVAVYRVPLLEHMDASDLLLLRSFNDDVKYVSRRGGSNNSSLALRVYGWSYTFEQLIADRLKYLGEVRLLDFEQKREGLLKRPGLRHVARVLGEERLRKFLAAVFPLVWYRLPAQGGVRYYVNAKRDEREWREEVKKAMLLARLIVLVLGETDGLAWEMGEVGDDRLARKTLFVMPPLILKKWHYRARWERFADSVCDPAGGERRLLLEKVNPRRVLVATVHGDALVVITGDGTSQPFYEAALDVATLLAVADPAQSARMIRKFLK